MFYWNDVSFLLQMRNFFLFCGFIFLVIELLAQSPSQSDALAAEAAEQGNWSLAFTYYQDAYSKDSLTFERKYQLAYSAMKVYEDALAIRLFKEVNSTDQGNIHPEALYYLAKLYQRKGDYPLAEQAYKKLKKKIAKVDPKILTKQELEEHISELSWAMIQPTDPSIELEWYSWNSPKSEAHAQWKGDTIAFQQWNDGIWTNGIKIPNQDSIHRSREQWGGVDVLQITELQNWKIGVGINPDGLQVLLEYQMEGWREIMALRSNQCRSSMPHLVMLEKVPTLFFASDRNGGQGGWDIWVSRWKEGWSAPFPLGTEVNTRKDDLAPYYDQNKLFFSSKGHRGFGEMDIFRCEGKPGKWGKCENMGLPINSPKNDIGLSVKRSPQSEEWLLSSARNGDGCCLDIGHWTLYYAKDSIPKIDSTDLWIQTIRHFLPLSLYFHNDEPDPKSQLSSTKWTYTDCYDSYLQKADDYCKNGIELEEWLKFEEAQLNVPYDQWKRIIRLLLSALKNGDTLYIQIRGFASPLATNDYNEKLTQRRIHTLINEIEQYDHGILTPYLEKSLFLELVPLGEQQSNSSVSDEAKNRKASIYSREARNERRIEIIGIRRL